MTSKAGTRRRTVAQWKALAPAYRSRLERRGVTRSDYLKGVPLSGARGHADTPEKPARAAKNPTKYAGYAQRQQFRGKHIKVASTDGLVTVIKMSKANRSTVGEHWNAVGWVLDPFRRDVNDLLQFTGRKVRGVDPATGGPVVYELETDAMKLVRLAQAGELDIEDIYDNPPLSAAA